MGGSSINKLISLACAVLVISGAIVLFWFPKDDVKPEGLIRIGAGDDVSGALLDAVVKEANQNGLNVITDYKFVDCCGSSAQWAMTAKDIDMGFYCYDIALSMVNNNPEFEIYGPSIMNSEILAVPKDSDQLINTVGIPKKRRFLEGLVTGMYPAVCSVKEVDRSYLRISAKADEVDAAVYDVIDATRITDDFNFKALTDLEYISYCMVVRKEIIGTDSFNTFLESYEDTVDYLNTPDGKIEAFGMDEDYWNLSGLKFLYFE